MKNFSILCLLAFVTLCGVTSCKEDPVEFNNAPEVFVDEATDLLRTSAVLTGRIMAPAKASIKEYGFKVSSTSDFSSADTDVYRFSDKESLAYFSQQITNLEIGSTYFYVAYASNGLEEMTSTLKTFTTPTRSGATISAPEILDIYAHTLKAQITDDGGSTINSVGFCWSTSPNPTIFTGEHEFATYDKKTKSFTTTLTKIKGRENYYICAFAECDVIGSGDPLISYSESVQLALKHKATLETVEATATTFTFRLTPFNAEQVKWLVSTKNNLTAEGVFTEGTAANVDEPTEVKIENLNPGTTYRVYAVAEANEELVLSAPLEVTTNPAPTIKVEAIEQDYTSLTFAITSAHAEEVKYLFLSEEELTVAGEITTEKVLAEGTKIEANKRVQIKKQELTTETTFYVYAAARIETAITSVASLELFTATTPQTWRIYYTSTDEKIVEPYSAGVFGANIVSNTYENGQGVIIFDRPVTAIGYGAFYQCSNLKSVTSPDSVISIGDYAFFECTGLTSINIPESVTSIGETAFTYCSGLTSLTIPDGITLIKYGTFAYCTGLASVTIGNGVTTIEQQAFSNCSSLTNINIPDSVTSIGVGVFYKCTGLTDVTIGDGVTSIGASAFDGCTSLSSVTMGNSVASIEEAAFYECAKLASITIPDSVISIGGGTFCNCTSLTSVTMGNGLTLIGEMAFQNCSSLKGVYISNIAAWCKIVFEDAESNPLSYAKNLYLNGELLTELIIPSEITVIRGGAFYKCTSLTSVTFGDSVTSIGNQAFRGCSNLTSVSIGNNVTTIERGAFYECGGLTNITIPGNVTMVGEYVFYNCSNLTNLTLEDGVISIGESAFAFCSSLTGVTIPDSTTTIGREAFYYCSNLTSVTIGNGVTSIEDYAFSGCYKLTSVYCKPTTPPIGSASMFNNNATNRKIYVPNESVEAYKAATYWSNYADAIVGYDF